MTALFRSGLTTLVVLAAAATVVVFPRGLAPARPPAPRLALAAPSPAPARMPTAGEILARGAAVGLTAGQRARLEALDRAWRADAGPLEAALRAAGEEFSRFMAGAQGAGRASLAEVRERAAEVSALGQSLRERRQAHATRAVAVLDERQRQRLGATVNTGGGR